MPPTQGHLHVRTLFRHLRFNFTRPKLTPNPPSRREGLRKRSHPHDETQATIQSISRASTPVRADPSYALSDAAQGRSGLGDSNSAYIAERSVLQGGDYGRQPGRPIADTSDPSAVGGITAELRNKVLKASDAHKLPKSALRQALFDAFFENLIYAFPIINRAEVESPGASVLLQQAVCLAGSLLRHPNLPDSFPRAHAIYEKVKVLICLNFESDMLVVLKVLCLLTLWSPIPSHIVSLDGPWHATGSALRLAVQMGMHRNSTYANKSDYGCRRRLWWLLYVRRMNRLLEDRQLILYKASDCVQALIYGRPPALKPEDFDVEPLTEDDFEQDSSVQVVARLYMADLSLASIMGVLASTIATNAPCDTREKTRISECLTNWMAQLPPGLRLYDESGCRTAYSFALSELYIQYFGTVILSQAMARQFAKQWPCSTPCLVASTCMASLYEEILYREQVAMLTTMHAFWSLTAAIPLLYYRSETASMEAQRKESLDILCSVVEQLRPRFGLARTVAHKIQRLLCERRDVLSQQSTDHDRSHTPGNNARQDEETASQLNALFPQLRAWASAEDSVLHNPILERVAKTHEQHEAQGVEQLVDPWMPEAPLSDFDALGASSFMDTLFDSSYHGDDIAFNLVDQI